jgi:chromosome segregation ATPase
MDIDKLKEEISKLVESILEQKGIAGMDNVENTLKSAEAALGDMVTKLADSEKKLSDNASLIEEMEKVKETLTSELAAVKADLEKVTSEKDVAVSKLATIEAAMKEIEDNKRLEVRTSELSSLKIARTGDALEKQNALVKTMTDEEFATYKAEMVAIREDLLKTVEEVASAPAADVADVATASVDTSPADVGANKETSQIVIPAAVSDSKSRVKDYSEAFTKYMDERNKRAPKK